MKQICVLAYSGGLDTSVCAAWLRKELDYDVICVTVDVGQGSELDGVRVRAEAAGAIDLQIVDAREEFVTDFCWPALKANALYEARYPLVSALSRPLIARHLVRIAREHGATAVGHGCTGKGNDQVRFETSIAALAPELRVIAPIRETAMQRDQALAYAQEHGIPVVATKAKPYSVDENLWGRAIESGILEDPWFEPPEKDVYEMTTPLNETSEVPHDVVVTFEAGIPVALDGERLSPIELVTKMNDYAGAAGVGRIDMIENRLVGIKSREVYEVPAAISLIGAHRDLEGMTLERDVQHYKQQAVEGRYAELVYYGLWFSPLKASLDAFIDSTQTKVSGDVRLRLHRGTAHVVGRRSSESLYMSSLATYGSETDSFSHDAAAGFIELHALPTKVWAQREAQRDVE